MQTTIVLHDGFGSWPYSHVRPTGEHEVPDDGDAGQGPGPPPPLEPLEPPELEPLLLDEAPLLEELPPEELLLDDDAPLEDDAPLLPPLDPELDPLPPPPPAPPSFPPVAVTPPHAASTITAATAKSFDLMSRPLPPIAEPRRRQPPMCEMMAAMSTARRRRTVLAIVATDATFERALVRGEPAWVGKCIHCQARLVVGLDGETHGAATIEHIVPRNHGGTDDVENLALACARCNTLKGMRLDHRRRDDPTLAEVVETLRARRRARWRDAAG